MKSTDWLPTKRTDRLAMAESWSEFMSEKLDVWNIPPTAITQLTAAATAAKSALSIPASTRNAITNAQLKMAFDQLTAVMRDIKRRYFFAPPLVESDFAALGLKMHDTIPTNIPAPTIPVEGELHFPAATIVEIRKIQPFGSTTREASDYGVRIYYGVMGTPDEADRFRMSQRPQTGSDLPHSVFTRRKSHRFNFPRSSGQEVFFCLRYENSKGEAGPWGSLMSAFIP